MKIARFGFVVASFLIISTFQLQAAGSTNPPTSFQESWESISNRWGSVPLEKIQQTAKRGDVTAQYYLAIAFYVGDFGEAKDQAEAFKWTRLAAEQGMPRAQRRMGIMLQRGEGVETNVIESAAWYNRAAQQGDAQAQMNLGWMYERGVGVSTNYVEAARLYRLAAEQGQSMAQNNLGWFYENGFGVSQDFDEALNWFQKSAAQGNAYAKHNLPELSRKVFDFQYQMSRKYQNGNGVPKDAVEAFKWMQKAAQSDYQSTEVNDALYELGLMYENGEGVQTNLSEAHDYITRAAMGGQPNACYCVGRMYENGDGFPQDDYQATRFYYNAVFNLCGRSFAGKAVENLLKLYAEGRGLVKTNQEPEDYIDQTLGNKPSLIRSCENQITTPISFYYLGKVYFDGKLIPQDLMAAAKKFRLATSEGIAEASKMLDATEAKMSPEQKAAFQNSSANSKGEIERAVQQMKTEQQIRQMMNR